MLGELVPVVDVPVVDAVGCGVVPLAEAMAMTWRYVFTLPLPLPPGTAMPTVTAMATGATDGQVTPSRRRYGRVPAILPIRAVEVLENQGARLFGDDKSGLVVDAWRQILERVVGRDKRDFLASEAGRIVRPMPASQ